MINRIILLILFALAFSSCSETTSSENESTSRNSVEKLESIKINLNNSLKTIDSLKKELERRETKFRSLEEATTSEFVHLDANKENEAYGFNYRVEIYRSEIYKSLFLTKVESYGEGAQKITSTYKIDLEKELNISPEQTTDLQFMNWNSASKFKIRVNGKSYTVQVVNAEKVEIKAKPLSTTSKAH